MNIELLNEVNKSLKNGISLTDISSELALQKSQIQLMLRIQKIVLEDCTKQSKVFDEELNTLKIENKKLKENNIYLNKKSLCSIVKPEPKHDTSFINELEQLKEDIKDLEVLNEDLQYKLSKYPYFIKYIFDEDERQ